MKRCSDTELQAMITRYERAVFAGTSSHRDVVKLIAAEREILRREAKRVKQTVHEERRARTASSSEGWLSITPEAAAKKHHSN
jgi:archaeosine-15-forming tRNA-guanine transglycosylase